MASIINRNGKLYIQYRIEDPASPKGYRYVRGATGLSEDQIDRAREMIASPPPVKQRKKRTVVARETITRLDAVYARYRTAVRISDNTDAMYECIWDVFVRFAAENGVKTMEHVTPMLAAQWQAGMAGKPSSINTKIRIVKSIWNTCLRLKLTTAENPFAALTMESVGRQKIRFVPWPDVQRLAALAFSDGRDVFLFVALCAYGGLRKSEALALKWEHVHWDTGEIDIPGTKSAWSADTIPLHTTLRVALEPFREEEGSVITQYWEHRTPWNKLVRKAGMFGLTPHQLRHSVATHLLDLGTPMALISRMLRHSDIKTTGRYADVRGIRGQIPDLGSPELHVVELNTDALSVSD